MQFYVYFLVVPLYQYYKVVNSLVFFLLVEYNFGLFLFCLSAGCGRNFFENNTSGYIFSEASESCNWTISVPYGNIIKLRFIEFQLEEHPSCSSDYIEVYDGYHGEFKLLGRYCGQRHPSFLKSSSNVLKILYSHKSYMSVFKLYFSSEKSE